MRRCDCDALPNKLVHVPALAAPFETRLITCDCEPVVVVSLVGLHVPDQRLVLLLQPRHPRIAVPAREEEEEEDEAN